MLVSLAMFNLIIRNGSILPAIIHFEKNMDMETREKVYLDFNRDLITKDRLINVLTKYEGYVKIVVLRTIMPDITLPTLKLSDIENIPTVALKSSESEFRLLKNYNPDLNIDAKDVYNNIIKVDIDDWISVDGLAFCIYKNYKKGGIWSYKDKIARFVTHKDFYGLPEGYHRHKPMSLFEDLTINTESGECFLDSAYLDGTVYRHILYAFNYIRREWVRLDVRECIPLVSAKFT